MVGHPISRCRFSDHTQPTQRARRRKPPEGRVARGSLTSGAPNLGQGEAYLWPKRGVVRVRAHVPPARLAGVSASRTSHGSSSSPKPRCRSPVEGYRAAFVARFMGSFVLQVLPAIARTGIPNSIRALRTATDCSTSSSRIPGVRAVAPYAACPSLRPGPECDCDSGSRSTENQCGHASDPTVHA